jgi:hypothetical protein
MVVNNAVLGVKLPIGVACMPPSASSNPVIHTLPVTPTPPSTVNAPVVADVAKAVLAMRTLVPVANVAVPNPLRVGPIKIVVLEPARPPVPIFSVLVLVEAVWPTCSPIVAFAVV